MLLENPERAWHPTATRAVAREEVERRIGPTVEPLEPLGGGLRNVNVRVGRNRVLRISADASTTAKEAALHSRPWRSFRTPPLLEAGDDFLVTRFIDLRPLDATPDHGAAVGRALAEIHAAFTYPVTGDLAADLSLARPFPEGGFSVASYGHGNAQEAAPFLDARLVPRVMRFFDDVAEVAEAAMDAPVLSHCDFKVSNLHVTPAGELVVLDWEFAWAGPRLLDVGELLRWHPPAPFVRAFADAYRSAGGVLVEEWRRIAAAVDLGSLLGLLASNPAARSTPDVARRIAETIDQAG